MANPEITLRIRADADGAVKVLQTSAGQIEKALDGTQGAGKRLAGELDRLGQTGKAALGVLAAGVAAGATALFAITKTAISSADALDEMSQRVGVSAKELSTLSYAAQRGGLDIGTFESAMVKLTKAASDTSRGTGEAQAGFEALGISVTNLDGTLKTSDQLLKEVATQFAGMEDGANKTALAVNLFGRSGAQMIPFLNQGAAGIAEVQERARELGLEIDNTTAAMAGGFNDSLDDLSSLAKGFGNDLATALLPGLSELTKVLVDNGIEGRKAASAGAEFAEAIRVVIGVGISAVAQIQKLGAVMGAVAAQVDVFFSTIGANFEAFKQYQDDVFEIGPIDAFVKFTKTGFDNVGGAIDRAGNNLDALKDSFADIDADAERKIAALNTTLQQTAEAAGEPGSNKGAAPALASAAAEVKKVGTEAKQAKEQVDPFRVAIDRLLDEIERAQVDQLAADMVQLQIALDEAIAQGDIDRANRLGDALETLSQQGIDGFEALGEAGPEAFDAIEAAAQDLQFILSDAFNGIGDALTTALFDGAESGADAIKNVMEQLARDLIRFWLQQQIIIPLQQQLMGGTGGQGGGIGDWLSMLGGGNSSATLGGNTQWGAFGPGSSAWSGLGNAGGSSAFGSSIFGNSAGRWFGGNTGMAAAGNVLGAIGGIYGVWDTWRNGPGGGRGALSGAASGAAAGTAIMPGIGTAIGAIVGALAGFFGGRDFKPRLRINDDGVGIGNIGTRGETALGTLAFNADDLDDTRGAERQFLEAIQSIDQGFVDLTMAFGLGEEQLAELREAASNWSIDLRDSAITAEAVLGSRFGALLDTFDQHIVAFVGSAGTLEERMGRLADALFVDAAVAAGDLLDNFDALAALLSDLAAEGETIDVTYGRLLISTRLLEDALDVMGLNLDLSREAFITFAAEIADAAGGLERATALWSSYFDTFYSDQERAQLLVARAGQQAADEFGDIGLALDDFLGPDGLQRFRAEFEAALPTLTPAEVAEWLEAANALGFLSEAMAELDRILREAADSAGEATAQFRELGSSTKPSGPPDLGIDIGALNPGLPADPVVPVPGTIIDLLGGRRDPVAPVFGGGDPFQPTGDLGGRRGSSDLDLLLGDYSNLKDRDKLKFALEGLSRGETSAEDVLAIGRRLYASGSDYNALFDQVRAMNGGAAAAERPVERETVSELQAVRQELQDLKSLFGMAVDNTSKTADGIGAMAQEQRFGTLGQTAARPRSSRGLPA